MKGAHGTCSLSRSIPLFLVQYPGTGVAAFAGLGDTFRQKASTRVPGYGAAKEGGPGCHRHGIMTVCVLGTSTRVPGRYLPVPRCDARVTAPGLTSRAPKALCLETPTRVPDSANVCFRFSVLSRRAGTFESLSKGCAFWGIENRIDPYYGPLQFLPGSRRLPSPPPRYPGTPGTLYRDLLLLIRGPKGCDSNAGNGD